MSNSKVQIYMDALVLETLLSDGTMTKTAQSGIVSSLVEKVKNLIAGHINPDDKVGSVVNMLVPGTLWALGFPITSIILEIAESWFGLNIMNILRDVGGEIKSLITGGHSLHSSDVEAIANRAVQNNAGGEPTQSQFENALQHPLTSLTSLVSLQGLSLRDARLYKVALLHIRDHKLTKEAGFLTTLGRFIGLKSYTANALVAIIKWVVVALLASVGLLAVDDAAHSLLGSPSKTEYTQPTARETELASEIPVPTSTQTVFKVNPAYQEERFNTTKHWIEPVAPTQIGDEIVQWTQDIYPDTKELTDDIKNTVGFNQAVQAIDNYNKTNTLNITFMPPSFTSRKKVVDMFIDELAHKAPTPKIPATKPHGVDI